MITDINDLSNKILTDDYFDTPFNEEIVVDVDKEIEKLTSVKIEEFKENKYRKGWKLEIIRINEVMMNFSLYNNAGKFIEAKSFNLRNDEDIEKMREYLLLFEDDPEKNLDEMIKIEPKEPIHEPDFDLIERSYQHSY